MAAKKKKDKVRIRGGLSKKMLVLVGIFFAVFGALFAYRAYALTNTVQYKGQLTDDASSFSYELTVGSGTITASHNVRNQFIRVSILDSNYKVLSTARAKKAQTSTNVTPGTYIVKIDYEGNYPRDRKFTLTVSYPVADMTIPRVIITSPTSTKVSNTTKIAANATDDTGISKVEILVDGKIVGSLTKSPYEVSLDTKQYRNGEHVIKVNAYDTSNNVSSASLTIEIANTTTPPPTTSGGGTTTTPPPTTPPVLPPSPSSESLGIWLSSAEIMKLPMSGPAWDNVKNAAYGSWGSPNLADNNSLHDTYTLAGALVAVRTGDSGLREKTRASIMSVMNSDYNRVLEMSRNITSYVIAADIIDLPASDDESFRIFIAGLRTKSLQGHSGGNNMRETALYSANNWGAMSRAAMAAIDLYLGDRADLDAVVNAHRAFLGESVQNQLNFTSTNWHPSSNKSGINRRGSLINGNNVDGVIPEDQRRTGEFSWPAPQGSYPWEALQGTLVTGVLLSRANILPINAGDDALYRAMNWLVTVNANPPSGDDKWQPWLMNKVRGTSYSTETGIAPGKNMAWTDWTHQ